MPLIHFSENPKSPSLLLRLEWTDEGDSSVVVGELLLRCLLDEGLLFADDGNSKEEDGA